MKLAVNREVQDKKVCKGYFPVSVFQKREYRHAKLMGENMRILGKEIKN